MSSKAEEYLREYEECFQVYNAVPDDTISSLSYLVEDMIKTLKELEESASKEYKLEASARTGIN